MSRSIKIYQSAKATYCDLAKADAIIYATTSRSPTFADVSSLCPQRRILVAAKIIPVPDT